MIETCKECAGTKTTKKEWGFRKTVRFNEDEQIMIDFYMQFQNHPVSAVIKEALLEDIDDFFDSIYSEEIIISQNGDDV